MRGAIQPRLGSFNRLPVFGDTLRPTSHATPSVGSLDPSLKPPKISSGIRPWPAALLSHARMRMVGTVSDWVARSLHFVIPKKDGDVLDKHKTAGSKT